jgi:acyl-CoA synthetase (AMP-forming)/AMP-acid ligase II
VSARGSPGALAAPPPLAVFHGDDRLTYAQLHDRVTRLAHGLRGLGVRRGDRVACLGPSPGTGIDEPAGLDGPFLITYTSGTGEILKKRLREIHGDG